MPSTDITLSLPPVKEISLAPWRESYGGDYYGALHVAAEYCGLGDVPSRLPGMWQHGAWPPWMLIRPELATYDAPKNVPCLVGRKDEADLLRNGGYENVRAIGLPIIYTKPSGLERVPRSLLIMPTHSLASDVIPPSTEQYVREVSSLVSKFSVVAASVSAYCMAKGLWAPEFEKCGIKVVRGAGISDANALNRLRAMFDSFEYMTTDRYGSHVFYALYFGVKVSIWGTETPELRENILTDGGWSAYPDAVDELLSDRTKQKAESFLGPLRLEPWNGRQNIDLGRAMLGGDNKLAPKQMRSEFHWTQAGLVAGKTWDAARRSLLWRAGSAAKRRLLGTINS